MSNVEFYCGYQPYHHAIHNTENVCPYISSGANECKRCQFLIIKEHLDSSPHIMAHTFRNGKSQRTAELDYDRCKLLFLMENPEFLEID